MLGDISISFPLACSIIFVILTSCSLNIWTVFGTSRARSIFTRPPKEASPLEAVQQRQYQLKPGEWSGKATFYLERRAILSQSWICVSHRGRFTKPGDYVSFDFAGFRLFSILGKDGVVRTFHNVCRHRAFPITHKTTGSATLLGCRYHGWSYDTKGQLTKAPQFDQLPGFDKASNSLFEVHTQTDSQGFIFINLDSAADTNHLALIEPSNFGRMAKIDARATFFRSWKLQGTFNWKSYFLSYIPAVESDILANEGLHFTEKLHYYPLTTVHTDGESSIWFQVLFSPDSPNQTTVVCHAFASNRSDIERFEKLVEPKLERYLNELVIRHEKLHPTIFESCNIPYTAESQFVRMIEARETHRRKESLASAEINPASVRQCRSKAFDEAEGICKAMEGLDHTLSW